MLRRVPPGGQWVIAARAADQVVDVQAPGPVRLRGGAHVVRPGLEEGARCGACLGYGGFAEGVGAAGGENGGIVARSLEQVVVERRDPHGCRLAAPDLLDLA